MLRDRILAVLLLVVALAGLTASKTFPFLDDFPEPAEIAVVIVGAASGLAGVWLWLRKADPGA